MTAFAGNVGVSPVEYKAGTKVIERLLTRRIAGRKQADDGNGHQKQAPGP